MKRTKKKSFLAKSLAIGCIIGAILWLVTITNERKRVPPVTVNLPDPTPTNQSQVQAPPTLGVIIRENTPVYLHNSSWQKPVTYLKAHDSVVLITPYKVLDRLGIVTERCDFVDRTTRKPSGSLREGDLVEITGTMESAGLYSIDSHIGSNEYVPMNRIRKGNKGSMYNIETQNGTAGYVFENCVTIETK